MNWYYAVGKERTGPIDDAQFEQLIRSGEITPSTLVWNETMPGWKRYGEVRDAAYGNLPKDPVPDIPADTTSEGPTGTTSTARNMGSCSQCGRRFPESDLLTFENRRICAACKPAFVQKIREGVSVGDMVYAGFWIRFAAKFIDGIILGIINMIIGFVTTSSMIAAPTDPIAIMRGAMFSGLFQFCVQAAYTSFFLGKFSATPGKMVCGLKVISPDNEPISYLRGFGRCCAEILSGMILAIGYLMAAWDPEKRALHDRICNTRVVKKG
jgi:uncharacterized RDD family membrane protein YckC